MDNRIKIIQGDITRQEVDAVVNAANTSLLGGGGVDGAIHRAAGPELLEETSQIGGCPTGESRSSRGYRLPAKWVIHTVGPVWLGGERNEDNLLASCYQTSFRLARKLGVRSIAFPAISTGVYRFPLQRSAKIALLETKKELEKESPLEKIVFVCFSDVVLKAYQDSYGEIFRP